MLLGDFVIPQEKAYSMPPPGVHVELLSLELTSPAESVPATPLAEMVATATAECCRAPEMLSYPASVRFLVSMDGRGGEEFTYPLAYDISFVTAHLCAPSHRVRMLKLPSSSTIQKIDVSGSDALGGGLALGIQDGLAGGLPVGGWTTADLVLTGHPLHKYYSYAVVHMAELVQKPRATLTELLADASPGRAADKGVLVVDCVTKTGEAGPQSPALKRVASSSPARMYLESQKRQFGSDVEVLARAVCAQRGWNAIVSRRRRGCLACAIREAGALGWRVIVRAE